MCWSTKCERVGPRGRLDHFLGERAKSPLSCARSDPSHREVQGFRNLSHRRLFGLADLHAAETHPTTLRSGFGHALANFSHPYLHRQSVLRGLRIEQPRGLLERLDGSYLDVLRFGALKLLPQAILKTLAAFRRFEVRSDRFNQLVG